MLAHEPLLELTMASIDTRAAKFTWKVKEGDREGLTVGFDFDITGYTGWAMQWRPGPGGKPIVDVQVDLTDAATNKVRFWLDNGIVKSTYDGWEFDAQVVNPDGGIVTFLEGEIVVDPQITV